MRKRGRKGEAERRRLREKREGKEHNVMRKKESVGKKNKEEKNKQK